MFVVERFLTLGYVLAIVLGGYFAVSSLKSLWTQASRFEQLASISNARVEVPHTLLVYDSIEPSTGRH